MEHRKYLHIRDWNYWWGVYRCGEGWEPPNGAEFSITEDEAGENRFFHFDFYNLAALEETLREQDFIEPENPDSPGFLEKARELQRGEREFFLGALYYPNYMPDLASCGEGVPLLRRLSPQAPPYYGVVFLREERPLTPDVLRQWAEKLSRPLFGEAFSCVLAQVPTRQEALEQLREEEEGTPPEQDAGLDFAALDALLGDDAPFLISLSDGLQEELRLVIGAAEVGPAGGVPDFDDADAETGERLREILADTRPIEIDERRVYEICFPAYILCQIRNESFCSFGPDEVCAGKHLVRFERSGLLSHVSEFTDAQQLEDGTFYPGAWTHYGIYTQCHVIDVIAHEPPTVSVSGPQPEARG